MGMELIKIHYIYASSQRIKIFKPGKVVQSYNLSAQEAKAG